MQIALLLQFALWPCCYCINVYDVIFAESDFHQVRTCQSSPHPFLKICIYIFLLLNHRTSVQWLMTIFSLTQNQCWAAWIIIALKTSTWYIHWLCLIPLLWVWISITTHISFLSVVSIDSYWQQFINQLTNQQSEYDLSINLCQKRKAVLLCVILLWTESKKTHKIWSYIWLGDVDIMFGLYLSLHSKFFLL